jgi:hypothetical protein
MESLPKMVTLVGASFDPFVVMVGYDCPAKRARNTNNMRLVGQPKL